MHVEQTSEKIELTSPARTARIWGGAFVAIGLAAAIAIVRASEASSDGLMFAALWTLAFVGPSLMVFLSPDYITEFNLIERNVRMRHKQLVGADKISTLHFGDVQSIGLLRYADSENGDYFRLELIVVDGMRHKLSNYGTGSAGREAFEMALAKIRDATALKRADRDFDLSELWRRGG